MPDEVAIDPGGLGAHHAVDPVRVEQALIDDGALVVELPVHLEISVTLCQDKGSEGGCLFGEMSAVQLPPSLKVREANRQEVTALKRYSAACTNLVRTNGNRHTDLARHAGAANDRLGELKALHDLADSADVGLLIIGVIAGNVVGAWERSSMGRQVKRIHGALAAHSLVVHDAVILPGVAAGRVEEDDGRVAIAGRLDEDLGTAPDGGVDEDVAAGDVVFGLLLLVLLFYGPVLAFAEEFEEAGGEVAVLGEADFVALDTDAFLFDVHSL